MSIHDLWIHDLWIDTVLKAPDALIRDADSRAVAKNISDTDSEKIVAERPAPPDQFWKEWQL